MSYILQALKKAEEARGATPGAVAMPGAPPPMSRPRWQWIAAGGAGLAGIGIAVALWTVAPGSSGAPVGRSQDLPARAAVDGATPGSVESQARATSAGAPAPVAAPMAAAAAPVAAPGAGPPTPTPSAPAPAVSATAPPAVGVEPRAVAAPGAVAPATDAGPRAQAPARGVERPSATDRRSARAADPVPAAPSRPESTPARATTETPVAPPVSATPPATGALAPVAPRPSAGQAVAPHIASAPAASAQNASPPAVTAPGAPSASASHTPPVSELRTLMAKLSLQVLSFSSEPRDRFVFVNGRKYVEGQAIDDKLLIERITDGGVVLSYRGERATLTSP